MGSRGVTKREICLVAVAVALGATAIHLDARAKREQSIDGAKRSSCISNLKQLGLAMAQYAQDNDETLPRAWFGRDAGPSDARANSKWMDAVFPYAKSEWIFSCPADSTSKPYRFRDSENYGSYLFNDAYFALSDKLTPPAGQKTERMNHSTILLACGGGGGFRFGWPDVDSAPRLEDNRLGDIQFRHSWQRVPVTSRVDGMAFSYPASQVFAPRQVGGRTVYTGLTIEDD